LAYLLRYEVTAMIPGSSLIRLEAPYDSIYEMYSYITKIFYLQLYEVDFELVTVRLIKLSQISILISNSIINFITNHYQILIGFPMISIV
jgi:hypothetical protein